MIDWLRALASPVGDTPAIRQSNRAAAWAVGPRRWREINRQVEQEWERLERLRRLQRDYDEAISNAADAARLERLRKLQRDYENAIRDEAAKPVSNTAAPPKISPQSDTLPRPPVNLSAASRRKLASIKALFEDSSAPPGERAAARAAYERICAHPG